MLISDEIKRVVAGSAFIALVTLNPDGTAHPIIAGKGEVADDQVIFGIYKMEKTQANLLRDKRAWLVGATKDDGPKGFRLSGTAEAQGKKLIFTVSNAETLL
jgi:hypothetical protein